MFGFGLLVSKNRTVLLTITSAVNALLAFTFKGAHFVFGDLSNNPGTGVVVSAPDGHAIGYAHDVGYFAFFVLPTIIFLSCLISLLYYIGIMQYVIQGLAWLMSKSMGTSGAETLSAVANIFVGQAESPLIIKPLLPACTMSEVMVIMTAGFANIATGVLALYSVWMAPYVRDAAGHLAACCFMSAPGALLVAKLIVPETEQPQTAGGVEFRITRAETNLIDAASRGTADGLHIAMNVGAMLISFTAGVALIDALLGWFSVVTHLTSAANPLSLEGILGWVFSPLAWLAGVPWSEANAVGSLLGIKTVLNEMIAYGSMKDHFVAAAAASGSPYQYLSPRTALIATYALCGFANFASIGIQVGGISAMAPTRRHDLSRLGLWAMVGGAISTLMAACIVGILI
jgi:CNT family concentrative nucleoside transporter